MNDYLDHPTETELHLLAHFGPLLAERTTAATALALIGDLL